MFEMFKMPLDIALTWWWTYTPIVLFLFLATAYTYYIQQRYIASLSWTMLEIRLPKEVMKTPKAMEQVLAGLHGAYHDSNLIEKYIDGEVPNWFSLEVVGINGETHFLIRTISHFRNLVEAQVYAQYPDAEIHEVEDYTKLVPPDIPNKDYDMWGTDMILLKEDAYPIRTYPYFEEIIEEKRIDPLASLSEVLNKLQPGEQIWVQILVAPILDAWKGEGERVVAGLMGRKVAPKKGAIESIGGIFIDTIGVLVGGKPVAPTEIRKEAREERPFLERLSPGEREVIKAIEENISKIGFTSTIRWIYIAKNEIFTKANVAAMLGVFRQFNTQNLNGFKPDTTKSPTVDYLFKKRRNYLRKRGLLFHFKKRFFSAAPFVLNNEELATIYHFPGSVVAAPLMPRIEAKKAEPPSGLPIE